MMQKLSLLLLFIGLTIGAQAQLEVRPYIGANFSDITETPEGVSSQAKLGGQVGVSLLVGNRFHFNPGIAYFTKSTELSSDDEVNLTGDQNYQGVMLPLMFGFSVADMESDPVANLRIFAGPTLTFLTQTEFTAEGAQESIDWNNTNWSGRVGAGVDISIFFIDAAYEFGLTNLYERAENTIEEFDIDDAKNNTFYVNVGVRLGF